MTPKDRGTLLINAVRYALGRRTYVVSDTCRIVRAALHEVDPRDCAIVGRDIREALTRGQCGDVCDHREWLDLLGWMGESDLPSESPDRSGAP